jgi:hypothetical protein
MLFFQSIFIFSRIVSTNTGVTKIMKSRFLQQYLSASRYKPSNRFSSKTNMINNTRIIVAEVLIVLDIVELIDLLTIS